MNSITAKFVRFALSLCLTAAFCGGLAAQSDPPKAPRGERPPTAPRVPAPESMPGTTVSGDGVTTERFIAVDSNTNIKLCVLEGNVKINGWERSEMRVFVKNGSRFGLKVLETDPATGKALWVLIANATASRRGSSQSSECLSGQRIEIDVPMNSSLNVTGRATETTIDSVKKAFVKNVEGNIWLRNIPGGITAVALQGDVTVENSGGAISLETTTGNIIGYGVTPGQIGDMFKAKTNSGAISLQKIDHRQIESYSISGSLLFNGKFLPGGQYSFKTSNGAIRLMIPEDTSCQIYASYGFGQFDSDLALKYSTENDSPSGKSLTATLGSGAAAVKITTSSGRIGIRKQ